MNKHLLLFCLVCLGGWNLSAQNTNCATAVPVVEGENVANASGEYYSWYVFTMPSADSKIVIDDTSGDHYAFVSTGDCDHLQIIGYLYGDGGFSGIESGVLVYIAWFSYGTPKIDWTLSVEPALPGETCNDAISAVTGLNSVPLTNSNYYWYQFTMPDDAKKIVITADDDNYVYLTQGDCSNFPSNGGFGDLVDASIQPGTTVFLRWDITQGETFNWNLSLEDLDPGDNCAHPMTAATGNNTMPATLFQEFWYSFITPDEPGKKIVVNDNGLDYDFSFYRDICGAYIGSGVGSSSLSDFIPGETILIRWSVYSGGNFDWTLSVEDVEQGDVCGLALSAVEGLNTTNVTTSAPTWSSLTLPADGRYAISVGTVNSGYVNVFMGPCDNLNYLGGNYQNTVITDIPVGAEIFFIWEFYDGAGSYDWNLEISSVDDNSCNNSDVASLGINSNPSTDRWWTYTMESDGYLTISSLDFTSEDTYVRVYDGCDGILLGASDDFNGLQSHLVLTSLEAGQTVYILWDDAFSSEAFDWSLKEGQSINFDQIPNKVYGDPPISLTATSTSGLPIAYSIITGPASIDGNQLSITGSGQIIVQAAQPGNNYYTAANSHQRIFNVLKGHITAKADNKTVSYNQAIPELTISYTGFVNGDNSDNLNVRPTASAGLVAPGTATGVYPITLSGGFDENYTFTFEPGELTIEKADQVILADAIPAKVIGDADFDMPALSDSGLPLTFEVLNGPAVLNGYTVSLGDTDGLIVIEITQNGNGNYNAATPVIIEFLLTDPNKLDQSISFNSISPKLYGSVFELEAISDPSMLEVEFEIISGPALLSGNTLTVTGVGDITVRAKQPGNSEYNLAVPVSQVFSATKANLTITAADKNRPYNMSNPEFTFLYDGFVNDENASVLDIQPDVETDATASSNVGEYSIALSGGEDDHYEFILVSGTLTISKADQTISFDELPVKSPDAAPFNINASASSGLPVSFASLTPAVATVSQNTITIHKTGSTTIVAMQDGDSNYNAAQQTSQTLLVKDGQTITFEPLAVRHYGEPDFNLMATATSGLQVSFSSTNTNVATVTGNVITITSAGTTTIVASQAGSDEFAPASPVQRDLVIEKGTQQITFEFPANVTFGSASRVLVATSSSGLPVVFSENSSTVSLNGNSVSFIASGPATINASQSGNDNYLPATSVERTFCVNPPKPIIQVNNMDTETPQLVSSAILGNQWFTEGGAIAGANQANYNISDAGIYSVIVTIDGCSSERSDEEVILVTSAENPGNAVSVFPNPATDELTIDVSAWPGTTNIVLVDVSGKQMQKMSGSGVMRMNVKSIRAGQYLLYVKNGQRKFSGKVFKK